jgi:hypothetical protein
MSATLSFMNCGGGGLSKSATKFASSAATGFATMGAARCDARVHGGPGEGAISPRRSTLNSSEFSLLIQELEDGQATFLPRLWRRKESRETRFLREIEGTGGASFLFSFERVPVSICCPRCQSDQIHRSRTRGILEHLLTIIFVRPYRCEDCDLRFFRCSMSDKTRPVRLGRTS